MTSSFVKVVFADSQGSRLFFPIVENVLTQMHIQLAARSRPKECIFTKKKYFCEWLGKKQHSPEQ